MATSDISKTVEILFGVSDQTRSGLESVKSEFQSLDNFVQGAAQPVADLTSSLLKAEAAIIATGAAIGGLAISTAGDYQTSISEVGTLLNLNADQNAEFAQSLIDYGRDASVALNDIVSASYIAISTGTDLADVTTALGAAEQLAVAGATDLETATGALSRTMNAYGFDAAEADRVSNALFITVQNGDTTMGQLASAIGRVASIAAASNVPVEDLLSSIAAITVAGVNTNETVTNLSALFKEFSKPTEALSTALGGMSLESNSLQEIMQRLGDVTGGSFNEFTKLFGSIEAVKAAVILANDSTGTFSNTLRAMEEETQNLQQAYEVMALTFDRVNQNLVNNIRATLIEAGTPLLEEYAGSVGALGDVFEALGMSVTAPEFQPVYTALEGFINQFNETLDGIAGALPEAFAELDFNGLIDSFGELGGAISEVFDSVFGEDLDLTKPEDLAVVLQKAVNGISSLTDFTTGVIESFSPVFDTLGEILEQVNGLTEDQKRLGGEIGGSALLLTNLGTVLGTVAITIRETGADITDVFNIIIGATKVVTNSLQVAFDAYVQVTGAAVSTFLSAVASVTPDFLGGEALAAEAEEFRLISEAAAENLKRNFGEMLDAGEQLNSGLAGEARAAAESIKVIPETTKEAADETNKAFGTFGDGFTNLSNEADLAGVSLSQFLTILKDNNGDLEAARTEAKLFGEALTEAIGGADGLADGVGDAGEKLQGFNVELINGVTTYTQTSDGLKKVNSAISDTGDEAKKSAEDITELEKTMLEIASNERIASLEFSADIKVAQIQAQAEQVVAAFDSIARTIESTSEATVGLYSLLGNSDLSFSEQWQIRDAAEEQQRLQKQAIQTQEKLVDAQVDYLQALSASLNSGDNSIKIQAEGLEPEIEAFMFKILDRIRIAMNAEQSKFLLGLGG